MSTCKGCGKTILWAETVDGKKIPVDQRAPVYSLHNQGDRWTAQRVSSEEFGVTHFATCAKANDFSASKKKGGSADGKPETSVA